MLLARKHRPAPPVHLTNAARLAAMRAPSPLEVRAPNVLRTARAAVRPLEPTDRDELARVTRLNREHLAPHCPLHREGERDEALAERLIELSRRGLETGRAWRAGVFDRNRRLLGLVNLNDIVRCIECRAEANWWVSVEHTGRGLATEAMRAVIDHGFADFPGGLGLHRITALIAPDNLPSRRVAAKLGLKRGSRTRPVSPNGLEIIVNGRSRPHDLYDVFAPLTGPRRVASRRPSLRAGLAAILTTEAAVRVDVA